MKPMGVECIRAAARGLMVCGSRDFEVAGISTDSRSIEPGDLFVALAGESFDGHDFIRAALDGGACGAVYSKDLPIFKEDVQHVFIKVSDTLTALGDIARAYRRTLGARVAGITGSNGKTTTKEMARHLLEDKLPTVASPASFNNFIGVPLTLFAADASTRVIVLEMGTNRPGEIARLAEIAAPDVGVITNVGRTHLEGLGSLQGVARAKAELVHGLAPGGVAILNADDPEVMKMRALVERYVTFGVGEGPDVFATDIERTAQGFKFLINGAVQTALNAPGRHNIHNALAAITVCRRMGLEFDYLAGRLPSFRLPSMRLDERRVRGALVINDAYNANPESMSRAIEELVERKGARKFLVFADMLELGEHSPVLHREIGRLAAESGVTFCWATGEKARHSIEGALESGMSSTGASFFSSMEALAEALSDEIGEGDVVLVKASRGMRLERLFELLK